MLGLPLGEPDVIGGHGAAVPLPEVVAGTVNEGLCVGELPFEGLLVGAVCDEDRAGEACLTCPLFVTTAEFLPQHRAQHATTLEIISVAEARGQTRMAQMNQQVARNLEKIITALENDEGGNPKMAADAP